MQFVISQIVSAWYIFVKMNIVLIDHKNIDINTASVILRFSGHLSLLSSRLVQSVCK